MSFWRGFFAALTGKPKRADVAKASVYAEPRYERSQTAVAPAPHIAGKAAPSQAFEHPDLSELASATSGLIRSKAASLGFDCSYFDETRLTSEEAFKSFIKLQIDEALSSGKQFDLRGWTDTFVEIQLDLISMLQNDPAKLQGQNSYNDERLPQGQYTVSLVGEQHNQGVVEGLRKGSAVTLFHEPENKFDEDAILVATPDRRAIGYVPRDNWLYEAINFEGKGASARVHSCRMGARGHKDVVIAVELNGEGLETL